MSSLGLDLTRPYEPFAILLQMGEDGAVCAPTTAMNSAVNWALLGLIIDRPSYAYELAIRFERTYDGLLSLSSVSHVYTALNALRSRGMIEQMAEEHRESRQKTRYRATAKAVTEYCDWLVNQVVEGRRRERLLTHQLAALARVPQHALTILDRCELACNAESERNRDTQASGANTDGYTPSAKAQLVNLLTQEEDRLAIEAKLAWVQLAQDQLAATVGRVPPELVQSDWSSRR